MRMIEDGERARDLRPGKIILDSTSENTGIADAMIGAALGSQVRFAMPAIVSPERRAIRRPTAGDKYMSTAMWRERREGSGSEQMDTPEEG
jgi:cysteine synthase